jgi:hypothetical protein
MSDTLKILAQSNPSAATLSDLYTVPALTQTSISSLVICNTGSTFTSFRVSVSISGATDEIKQYLYYNLPIPGNETFIATVGMTLNQTDKIRVFSSSGTLSFNLFGAEIT